MKLNYINIGLCKKKKNVKLHFGIIFIFKSKHCTSLFLFYSFQWFNVLTINHFSIILKFD